MSAVSPTLDPRTPPIELLRLIGPESERENPPARAVSLAEARDYCRGLATSHYENFSVLTSLVPERLRDDFAAVYSFCRWADDLGDETGADAAARARAESLLAWWRAGLDSCVASRSASGEPAPDLSHPVFIALRETFRAHPALTAKPFRDLIDAFVQDQRITRYQTYDQVLDYCTRSADPVGRIVLALGGYADDVSNAEMFNMSDATCTALQLINFWQDVRRDLVERDRIYIPAETGVSPELLRDWINRPDDPGARVPFIRAVRPLVERASRLFEVGRPLPSLLNTELAPVVWMFGAGGEAILSAVERIGCATLWERPTLSRARKASLFARAWLRSRLRFPRA